jgi:hypothetical protein
VTTPGHGTASVEGDKVVYTPTAGYGDHTETRTDSFGYTVADAAGRSATATVHVTLGPLPDRAPTAADLSTTTAWNTPVTLALPADDPDSDPLAVTFSGLGEGDHVTADGLEITYTPTGVSGPRTFGYTVDDGHGRTASGSVTVVVAPQPIVLTLNGDHPPGQVGDGGTHWSVSGIPAGKTARLTVTVSAFDRWGLFSPSPASDCDAGQLTAGTLTLHCTLTGSAQEAGHAFDYLHADFYATGDWTVTGTLTPLDFEADPVSYRRSGTVAR